ncbi:MAG: polyprenyl diphosphate synthase [Candidatus Kaiserbacteria bacterium]|nr:polyprenyl diphosphate synthase [Candidatus Kaiserbacteria bacterium]
MNTTSGITCVGIIMDGNRRWAKARGLPKLEGHRAGSDKLKEAVRLVRAHTIAHLVVYAFSTENWNRESSEVSYLMDLFKELIEKEMRELGEEGVRIRFVGQRERFSKELQQLMGEREEETKQNTAVTVWICLSYGGHAEIVAAANKAAQEGLITEETLARNLWTVGMPDPDLIIRTGGEKRLSNFLPWQTVYSELFFTESFWPDFGEEEFDAIITEFAARERRHGK